MLYVIYFVWQKKLKQINVQNETNQGHKIIKVLNRAAKTAILSSTASGFEGFSGKPLPKVSLRVSPPFPPPPPRSGRRWRLAKVPVMKDILFDSNKDMHSPGSLTRYFWLKAIERSSWTILFSNSVFNKYTFLSFLTVCRVCFTGALEDLKAHVSKNITAKNAVPAKIFPLIFTVCPLSFNNLYCIRLVFRRFYGALQVLNVRQKKAYMFCLATTRRRQMTRFHSRVSFALFQKGVVCCMQGMQFRARDCTKKNRKSFYIFSPSARKGHLLTLFYAIAMHVSYVKGS